MVLAWVQVMAIHTYKTSPLEDVLSRILARGESYGHWYCTGGALESDSGCGNRVRVEVLDASEDILATPHLTRD
jgi:hypothetical protein